MKIVKLHVENLRNLEAVTIEPHARLNLLFGDNGAGKTSILEAISVLSRGRSFRTPHARELTGPGETAFRVFATTFDHAGREHRLGLERSPGHWRGRIDGEDVRQLSQLSRLMPSVVLEPESHLLVSGPPETRRRLLDWGMFHVERDFLTTWRSFSRALKQRNSALRAQQIDVLDGLDSVLAEQGARLHEMRQNHADLMATRIEKTLNSLKTRLQGIELNYVAGWRGDRYDDALASRRAKDLEQGATGAGPHRADLGIMSDGVPARTVLSRGEQKALAAALMITQADLMTAHGLQPLLLLDDLYSEFDKEHFEAVLDRVLQVGGQVWVTGTTKPLRPEAGAVFHVEHGRVEAL